MHFAKKELTNGSVWKPRSSALENHRYRVRFAILPRKLRLTNGGSIWVALEQYCTIETRRLRMDWNGNSFYVWVSEMNTPLSILNEQGGSTLIG